MRGKCRYGDGCNSDRRRLNRPYGGHIELIRFKEWDDQGARARSDTAILKKGCRKKSARATISESNMGYHQYAVPDNAAVESSIDAFL